MNGHMMRALEALLFILTIQQGYDAQIIRASSDPVRAFEGSDAVFQWILSKDLTSRPDFQGLVFGLWRNGYIATYITTVTKAKRIISNPGLKDEAPHLDGRVQWKGDLSKSLAAFQISHVSAEDQTEYGLMIDFGALKDSKASFVSLQIQARKSSITAVLSPPLSVTSGGNASFYCEFYIGEVDKSLYDAVTVGLWEVGGIYRTLSTLTKHGSIIMNPKLYQEAPEYHERVYASYLSNNTSNTSVISVVLADVKVSDARSYGCSMDFGPFKEPVGTYVRIEVQGPYNTLERRALKYKSQKSLTVRAGRNISIPCPALAKAIQEDGTFKWLSWSYCKTETCTTKDTKWSRLAGFNSSRATEVTNEGRYANRTNLIQNGILEIYSVQVTDATDYRCTVTTINHTSAKFYTVTIRVDPSVGPVIKTRSPSKVTVSVGNTLFLKCQAVGVPRPLVTWSKDGEVLQKRTNDTNFVREYAKEDDNGNYECKASNPAGSDSYRTEVIITEVIKGEDPKDKSNTWNNTTIAATTIAGALAVIVICLTLYICFSRSKRRKLNRDKHVQEPIDRNTFLMSDQ